MKKNKILLPILIVFALFLSSCESSLHNTFTFKNLSAGKIYVNFRANIYEVPVGKTFTIKDVPKGTFTFSTTYEIPSEAVTSTVSGDASGSVIFKQNTRVLVLYSSTLSEDGAYTLYAALTTSDDLTEENPTAP